MTEFVCAPLSKQHNREQFDCGVPVLNHYLEKIAGQDVKRKAAAVFVLTALNLPERVVGYSQPPKSNVSADAVGRKFMN